MMLRFLSRCKGIHIWESSPRFLSSSSSDGPPSKVPAEQPEGRLANEGRPANEGRSANEGGPANDKRLRRPVYEERNRLKEQEEKEAKRILGMLAAKKEAEDKRMEYLKQEEDASSSYDKLKKMYIERNVNKYDSDSIDRDLEDETPMQRIIRVIKNDFKVQNFVNFVAPGGGLAQYGTNDFLIVGSGISASLLGYYLKAEVPNLEVTILEEDSLIACEPLGINGESLIMQWDMPHYIKMANFAFDFYRSLPLELRDESATLKFTPYGSLMLSPSSSSEEDLDGRCAVYDTIDWQYERLNEKLLSQSFPWLNLDGVREGIHGLRSEGWIDPWNALAYSRTLAQSVGVHFLRGKLLDIVFNQDGGVEAEDRTFGEVDRPMIACVRLADGRAETVDFTNIVLASGLRNRFNSLKLHIGNGPGYLQMPLPLRIRKRFMFRLRCFDTPVVDFPLIMDPSGFRIRREGYAGRYLCWRDPSPEEEPDVSNLDVDMSYFEEKIRPALVRRIPSFENAEVESSWAGFIDANVYDGEPIIGSHPSYGNVFLVTGLGSKELIFSPAIAKASAELLLGSENLTVDCSAFLLDRVIFEDPIKKTSKVVT